MAVAAIHSRFLSSKCAVITLGVTTIVVVTIVTRWLLPTVPTIDFSQYGFRQLQAELPVNDLARLSRLVAGSSSRDENKPREGGQAPHDETGPAAKSSNSAHPTVYPVPRDSRLLLPILPYGPNNQFRGFRDSLVLAEWLNRTLVVPPFFKHHTAVTDPREAVEVEEIFDWVQLANLQPVVYWTAWRDLCGRNVEVVFQFQTVKLLGLFARIEKLFSHVGIASDFASTKSIRQPKEVMDTFNALMSPAEAQRRFSSTLRCAVVVFPYRHVDISHDTVKLALHLRRAKRLQKLAGHFAATRMSVGAAPYAVFHWRYNNEWSGVWCHQAADGSYDEGKVKNPKFRSMCRDVITLNVSRVPEVLSQLMQQRDISRVYVATPVSDFSRIMKALRKGIPGLLTSRDLLSVVGEDSSELRSAGLRPVSSNFELSIIEQELASTAPTFIGSRLSTWSSNVVFERQGLFNRMRTFSEPVLWINDLLR